MGVQEELFHRAVFLEHFHEDCPVHLVHQVPVLTWETLGHQVPFHSWDGPLIWAQGHWVPSSFLVLQNLH